MTEAAHGAERLAIADLVNRLLENGVVVAGDLAISVADVDLVYANVRVLLTNVDRLARPLPAVAVAQDVREGAS